MAASVLDQGAILRSLGSGRQPPTGKMGEPRFLLNRVTFLYYYNAY